MAYRRENEMKTFFVSLIFIIIIAAVAFAGFFIFGGEAPAKEDQYPWITSDPAAISGMLDGSYYSGEKNPEGILSYKIAGEITVGSDGKGSFKIENSGKNTYLMKVTILLDEGAVYKTGYIKPNEHIAEDVLDVVPEQGTYDAKVFFEGFDPNTEESIGATEYAIKLTVIP